MPGVRGEDNLEENDCSFDLRGVSDVSAGSSQTYPSNSAKVDAVRRLLEHLKVILVLRLLVVHINLRILYAAVSAGRSIRNVQTAFLFLFHDERRCNDGGENAGSEKRPVAEERDEPYFMTLPGIASALSRGG